MAADRSIVEYLPSTEDRPCGYCGFTDSSQKNGMWGFSLRVIDYQDLIDRGWRRSGQYCYKPSMETTCCPMYTIRCAAKDFKLTKSQKKILKRFHHFLASGTIDKNAKVPFKRTEVLDSTGGKCEKYNSKTAKTDLVISSVEVVNSDVNDEEEQIPKHELSQPEPETNMEVEKKVSVSGAKPKRMKAKYLRIERKKQKLQNMGLNEEEIARKLIEKKRYPVTKTIEDFVDQPMPQKPANQLKIKIVRSYPPSPEFEETFDATFDLYKKYQIAIHRDPPEKLNYRQFQRFLVDSPLQIQLVLVRSPEFQITFEESASLFAKYQKIVHKESDEDCSVSSFTGFLVRSPLEAKKVYGSYHQQYWLNGKLIAVGVIDILPRCVSSVYFYYDPDYSYLNLGTYGALREIEFTRSLTRQHPELRYYYMGFYIHSCVKMKYKAAFYPSYLLCPEVYSWHPVSECLPKLDMSKYSRLNSDALAKDRNSDVSLSDVLVLHKGIVMSYATYEKHKRCRKDEKEEIAMYAKLVGMVCTRRMFLYRK